MARLYHTRQGKANRGRSKGIRGWEDLRAAAIHAARDSRQYSNIALKFVLLHLILHFVNFTTDDDQPVSGSRNCGDRLRANLHDFA